MTKFTSYDTSTGKLITSIYDEFKDKHPQRILRMRDAFIERTNPGLQERCRRLWGSIQGMFLEEIKWQETP